MIRKPRFKTPRIWLLFQLVAIATGCSDYNEVETAPTSSVFEAFQTPPSSARPGVYWYFMDGNQNRDEMAADLEAMARVGIGRVIYLEVNIGVPRGPVDFMSDEWQSNFAFAVETAERLGIEVILGTGPGWAGSGGPWVPPEDSMQHLTSNTFQVTGPQSFNGKIEVPEPLEPNHFHGMSESLQAVRGRWYEDVAVLAFPSPTDPARIELADLKTLKETQPYSIWKNVPRFVDALSVYSEPSSDSVIDSKRIVDLSGQMSKDGTLSWEVPEGRWTIMRFVSRSTGQTTRPAPTPGHGFETDKFRAQPYLDHWDNYQGKLLEKVSAGQNGKGWTRVHLDSWEMSSQNWSQGFRDEFLSRRGYDPQPFFPAYAGMVVDSRESTERFFWDLRKTAQELVLENYVGTIKATAHAHGMEYSNEPYDMNPAGNIDLGSVADIPMCEFWDYRNSDLVDTLYSCIAATSIAHTMGKSEVPAEAFTSVVPLRFHAYPGQMKNQTDWALAFGITNFIFHTFQHQPLGDDALPGLSMGPFGVNWHRNQNWWDMLPAYHEYVSRSSYLLQQGVSAADILYLTVEDAPHIFLPPASAMEGVGVLQDKRGYQFDAVTPRILRQRAEVSDGQVTFEGGTSYKLLVLPDKPTMTPESLRKIIELVRAGATVVGNPPKRSPSLVGYPDVDAEVRALATELWGSFDVPSGIESRVVGDGKLFWGNQVYANADVGIPYPHYELTVKLLNDLGVGPDFSASESSLRFIHRRSEDLDIYFVSNRSDKEVMTTASFRVSGLAPELWSPRDGDRRLLPEHVDDGDRTQVKLKFAPFESYFIVFTNASPLHANTDKNFRSEQSAMPITGPWEVAFDPARGGPEAIEFDDLIDWSVHPERGVRYYSGKATYTVTFDLAKDVDPDDKYVIDIGLAYEMAKVSLNGVSLGVAWTAPWQLSTRSALKREDNVLTVEVANSWENRLIGDQTAPDKDVRTLQWPSGLLGGAAYKTGRYTFTTYVNEASDFGDIEVAEPELQPSGLIGPVRLIKLD